MTLRLAFPIAAVLLVACATEEALLPPPPPGTPMKMRKLNTAPNCEDFQRNADGSWTALRDTTIYTTHGPEVVKQGTTFKDGDFLDTVDVAWGLTRLCLQSAE